MPTPDWTELTRFALELAEASAKEIMPHFRNDIPVDVKAGVVWDPVTEGDRAGERVMRAMIEERFPDHGIHGEEYGTKPSRSGLTWVLDPVDGTRAFISGMPTWATLIGLNFEGRPKVGVMNQPFVGETFYGNPDGAWSRYRGAERKLATRAGRPLAEATFTTTAPELYRSEAEKAVFNKLRLATQLTRYGGDAYFFCVLAAGQVDLALDAHLQPYDIAPLIPIIEGAGGVVTTWDRGEAAQGGNVIAAGSRALHEEALAVITPA
ncbi:histidinol-phosphatase [Nordella sp. HKS 07]|uniref:histidinol-phosphatase n=1 Tax=Nordella sp. HKS 07 TaxID=2712222 RepID=UPI0013E14E35|nr:histidinol-phosphatase [Nordella sp. HKS 07]QIG46943.1 histidinol-phosphatase [Nordella sp. HKS 07]